MTLAQLKQASITYLSRPTGRGWVVFVGWAALTATSIGVAADVPAQGVDGAFKLLQPILLGCVFSIAALNRQLQWQLASPRARLTPNYAAPHVAVWVGGCFISLLAIPLLIALRSSSSAWATTALASLGAVAVVKPQAAWLLFVACLIVADLDTSIAPWINGEGYRALVLAAVTAGGWFSLWRYARRLTAFTEEDSTYAPPAWDAADRRSARPFRQAKAAVSFTGRSLLPASARQDGSLLSVFFTFHAPTRFEIGLTIWQCATTALPLILFAYFCVRRTDGGAFLDAERWSDCMKLLAPITLLAAAIPAVRLAEHAPRMSAERLLPFSNQRYVDLLLLGGGKACLGYWLSAHLTALAITYALPWEGVGFEASDVAVYLAMSLAGLLVTYAAAACCAAYSGLIPLFAAAIVGVVAIVGLPAYWVSLNDLEGHGAAPFWTVVCAIAGVGLLQFARFVWRERELD